MKTKAQDFISHFPVGTYFVHHPARGPSKLVEVIATDGQDKLTLRYMRTHKVTLISVDKGTIHERSKRLRLGPGTMNFWYGLREDERATLWELAKDPAFSMDVPPIFAPEPGQKADEPWNSYAKDLFSVMAFDFMRLLRYHREQAGSQLKVASSPGGYMLTKSFSVRSTGPNKRMGNVDMCLEKVMQWVDTGGIALIDVYATMCVLRGIPTKRTPIIWDDLVEHYKGFRWSPEVERWFADAGLTKFGMMRLDMQSREPKCGMGAENPTTYGKVSDPTNPRRNGLGRQ